MLFPDLEQPRGATFSPCGLYRYKLWRHFNPSPERLCNFIMLNPSTAGENVNDPTVERCERRAREYGYDGLIVTNLFAWRSTDPRAMKAAFDPVGPENDAAILAAAQESAIRIVAWGLHGLYRGRSLWVYEMLSSAGLELHALRILKDGSPEHPLYVPYTCRPVILPPW